MYSLIILSFCALLVLQVSGQRRTCQRRDGREPNLSDNSCASFLVCSNFSGQLRRCRNGQLYDVRSESCRAASEVRCNTQRRNQARTTTIAPEEPEDSTDAPETETTTAAPTQTPRPNTLLTTLLQQLFPQPGANIPGLGGLQGNVPPGLFPGGVQGFGGGLPAVDGGRAGFGVQGLAAQNPLLINLLGNNAAALPGNDDVLGGVFEQNVNVLNPKRQRAKPLIGSFYPQQQDFQPNIPRQIHSVNQIAQNFSPYIPLTPLLNHIPQNLPNSHQTFDQIPQYASPVSPVTFDQIPQYASPNSPQTFNQIPQNLANSPQTFNQIPQNLPNSPQTFNQIPQNLANSPQTLNQIPQNLPNSPDTLESQTTSNQAAQNVNQNIYPNVPQLSGMLK